MADVGIPRSCATNYISQFARNSLKSHLQAPSRTVETWLQDAMKGYIPCMSNGVDPRM